MFDFEKLRAPFAPDKISWRVGSTNADKTKGMALAYIDARDAQDRLDEVCGPDGWQCRYVPMHDKKTVCEIGVRIHRHGLTDQLASAFEWIWKSDGAGDTDIEAEKGALSDAFKRAAVRWGIGRYLYDLDSPWVALEPAGRSFKIAAGEYAKLRTLLSKPLKPAQQHTDTQTTPAAGSDVTAALWCVTAESRIIQMTKASELTSWLQRNSAGMDKLEKSDPALFNTLTTKIVIRKNELEAIAG